MAKEPEDAIVLARKNAKALKIAAASLQREQLVHLLVDKNEWLTVKDRDKATLLKHGDAIDALVCALLARLVSQPQRPTDPATILVDLPEEKRDDVLSQIGEEGWIHLPPEGWLEWAYFALDPVSH